MSKPKKVVIATDVKEVDDKNVEVTCKTLDQMVLSFKNYLKGTRNIPRPNNRNFGQYSINAVQYVHNIICVTTALIEQGVLTSDPYGFVLGNVTTFDRFNTSINEDLIPLANKIIKKEHEQALKQASDDGVVVTTVDKELTSSDVAKIVSEPTEEAYTKIVEVITHTGKKWVFDKENFTLSYKRRDGSIKIMKLANKDTWRATIITFFFKILTIVRTKYIYLKDRCIGIKQSIQWKWLTTKFKIKQKFSSVTDTTN